MRTSAIIASFIALAASAPLDLPTLPISSGLPSLPAVALPKLPVELPKLPAKRGLLDVEAADAVDVEITSLDKAGNSALPDVGTLPVAVPKLPVKRFNLPELGLPEAEVPALPEVGLPTLPEVGTLPKLPVKRDGLGLPALPGVGLPEEVKNLLDEVKLPVKRDGLGVPALPGVGLPEELKNLLDEVKLPVKRAAATVAVDPKVEATIEEVIETLTGLVGDVTQSLELQQIITFVINTLTGLVEVSV